VRRRTAALLAVLGAATLLPGCGISLFSRTAPDPDADRRIVELERRLDRIEQHMQQTSPPR